MQVYNLCVMMYVKLPKAVVLYAIDILSESGC